MKNLILASVLILIFSCQEKISIKTDAKVLMQVDSLISIEKEFKNSTIYKFKEVLDKEKNNISDTLLIKSYEKLLNKDELFDLYIWDRIHTINNNVNQINVVEDFIGTYIIKPIYNRNYAEITSIKIRNDSCFMFKNKSLVISDKINFRNSSNKYIKGKIILNNYRLLLDGAIKSKLSLLLDDNHCMDCEQLQFYKIN